MEAGRLLFHKEPSVPSDPSASVERGIAALVAEHGVDPAGLELVVHGTTIGLNAIIQRRGARMAMVVSPGNRDVLEIARLRLPSSYDFTSRARPLVPRRLMFEVSARVRSDGTVECRPDEQELDDLARRIAATGVEAVAVMLLNSYRDATLEREVGTGCAVASRRSGHESAVLWPEVREYERSLVAGSTPISTPHDPLFRSPDRARRGTGRGRPIYITANNGGTLSLDSARRRPIDTVLSGPASGVVASTRVGGAVGPPQARHHRHGRHLGRHLDRHRGHPGVHDPDLRGRLPR